MYARYVSPDSYYSHGFIIPFVTGYLIWNKLGCLKSAKQSPSMWGLILIAFAMFLHLMGTVFYIFSISGFSIFFLVFGCVLFIFGKKITRIVAFPLLFLLFMFPVPLALILAISFPMKMLVAQTGVMIVSMFGIPIYREGFQIFIPAGQLLVDNPCSGLRSLIAFLALGAVMAYISEVSNLRKLILFVLSIPIAIFSNIVRVPMLILISDFWGLDAAAPDTVWHSATGIFVFALGLILMISLNWMLKWKK